MTKRIFGDKLRTLGFEKPSVRVIVNNKCPLKCEFCPTAGDAGELISGRNPISLEVQKEVIQQLVEKGYYYWSLTGGEPTSFPKETKEIIYFLDDIIPNNQESSIKINTNGIGLNEEFLNGLEGKISLIKISIDSLKTPTGRLDIRNNFKNRDLAERILNNVDLTSKKGFPIRIHSVFEKANIDEFSKLFNYFVLEKGFNWKAYETSYFRTNLGEFDYSKWKEEIFVSLEPIIDDFTKKYGEPKLIFSTGKNGSPMSAFEIPTTHKNNPIVRFRNISVGSHYSGFSCDNCSEKYCHEGIVNLFIHPSGGFTTCRLPGKFHPFSNPNGIFNQKLFDKSLFEIENEVFAKKYFHKN
ncbi:MAG: radical SAM protein [Nanoarchaeota archaeon]|nr:radical SAM protein [Nanoarchaeota archaeon]